MELTPTQLLEQLAWDLIDEHGLLNVMPEPVAIQFTPNECRLLLWQLGRVQQWPTRYTLGVPGEMSKAEAADQVRALAISAYAQIGAYLEKLEAALDAQEEAEEAEALAQQT